MKKIYTIAITFFILCMYNSYGMSGSQSLSLLRDYQEMQLSNQQSQNKQYVSEERALLDTIYNSLQENCLQKSPFLNYQKNIPTGLAAALPVLQLRYPEYSLAELVATYKTNTTREKPLLFQNHDSTRARIITQQIIDREHKLANTHCCLYHAVNTEIYLLLCINTYLDHIINGTELHSDFIKFRANGDFYNDTCTLEDYCKDENIDDVTGEYRNHLLSASLTFPDINGVGESAFEFFVQNRSEHGTKKIFEKIMSQYPINPYTKYKIWHIFQDIIKQIDNENGVLLQICIPHNYINTCAYTSRAFGKPYDIYADNKKLSMHEVLEQHKNDIKELKDASQNDIDMSKLQARIRLDYSLFAHPGKISIHTYNGFTDEIKQRLREQLKTAVNSPVSNFTSITYKAFDALSLCY